MSQENLNVTTVWVVNSNSVI